MLFVSGAPGEGKSTLSFVMCRYLEQELSTYSTTSIKWFPPDDEHSAMRSLRNMARCCSMLAAAGDANYCRNVDEALRQAEAMVSMKKLPGRP
jgi:pantothenate kinase-related protein Tda10